MMEIVLTDRMDPEEGAKLAEELFGMHPPGGGSPGQVPQRTTILSPSLPDGFSPAAAVFVRRASRTPLDGDDDSLFTN